MLCHFPRCMKKKTAMRVSVAGGVVMRVKRRLSSLVHRNVYKHSNPPMKNQDNSVSQPHCVRPPSPRGYLSRNAKTNGEKVKTDIVRWTAPLIRNRLSADLEKCVCCTSMLREVVSLPSFLIYSSRSLFSSHSPHLLLEKSFTTKLLLILNKSELPKLFYTQRSAEKKAGLLCAGLSQGKT